VQFPRIVATASYPPATGAEYGIDHLDQVRVKTDAATIQRKRPAGLERIVISTADTLW
jgi:hypothetical protein